VVEMPDRVAENLVQFIRQNKGKLSKKRREAEFDKLRDDEVLLIERIIGDAFQGLEKDSRSDAKDAADD
jgi:hypothetical protein